jgi:hypothetical protein
MYDGRMDAFDILRALLSAILRDRHLCLPETPTACFCNDVRQRSRAAQPA